MDFAYSPHRETGGTMHLQSPTHSHGYHPMEGFASIQQLRRSLSRSPSKPSRFQLRTAKSSDSPGSPISPLALARAFSPRAHKNDSPATQQHPSPLAPQAPPTTKKKFSLRRTAPFRSSPRTRAASKSPRRALMETSNHINTTPFVARNLADEQENAPAAHTAAESPVRFTTDHKSSVARLDYNDQPIKFGFARTRTDTNAPGANCLIPPKSSPLKRSDGLMNLDKASMGSPNPKRRSLHGPTMGIDFDVFEHGPTPRSSIEDASRTQDTEMSNGIAFSSPIASTPLRKSTSLRKSTLSHRYGNAPRPRPGFDGEFAIPGPAASRTRQRMSLDSSLSVSTGPAQTPMRKSMFFEPAQTPVVRGGAASQGPHPLSHTLTPSSSTSSLANNPPPLFGTPAPSAAPMHAPPTQAPTNHLFAKSLPLGAAQPTQEDTNGPSETPQGWKMAKPLPQAFMSTGLISKKHRNVDEPPAGTFGTYVMPDTPSKRQSFPPVTGTPSFSRSIFPRASQPQPEFGTPSTPFSFHASKASQEGLGTRMGGLFGNYHPGLTRRGSFASIDGDDNSNDAAGDSPISHMMADSQSSNDDMPPTPTKQYDGSGRRSKENSLRSNLFGRRRASIGMDLFNPPADTDAPSIDLPSPCRDKTVSSFGLSANADHDSPHTPQEPDCLAPPDPSRLSISGHARRGSLGFDRAANNASPVYPATPTAPRDHSMFFGKGKPAAVPLAGLTKNDVDVALTSRFEKVSLCGNGEFSQVYRVENRIGQAYHSPPASRVWAVKKTKKPYTGVHDREKKWREVHVLEQLKGNEHVVSIAGRWEHDYHLYIQTEFCENGNLKDFLSQAGYKSRLDDFRIWKILLELALGLQHIHNKGFVHLDMKPANVLIDWEGTLKIADFGMATVYPAPAGTDAEGDRHYLAPEAFMGQIDKPLDVYALGLMLCEIAANIVLPENGASWQRLRHGDFSELPSLTWSSESSLYRDEKGEPISEPSSSNTSASTLFSSDAAEEDSLKLLRVSYDAPHRPAERVVPPNFMIDPCDPDAMDFIVKRMLLENPAQRPAIEEVLNCGGCLWVNSRRRAGATIFEGNWGPSDDILAHGEQHPTGMMVDMMDIS